MPSKDDIADGERLERIQVRVKEAQHHSTSSLGWHLTVEDHLENEFEVKIWHTHEVDVWWREGWWYVLEQGRGARWDSGAVVLHSTADFKVSRPDNTVDLLVIGDSHIGRENRPDATGEPHRTARQFLAAVGYATRYDVAAIVHAGDLFDDAPTEEDFLIIKNAFAILAQHNIPVYFISGNHGVQLALDFYDELADAETFHLGAEGVSLDQTVELFGIDHGSPETVLSQAADISSSAAIDRQILVVHNEIDPPRQDSGIPAWKLIGASGVTFDCILAGHLHSPETATWSGTIIQHLGSTAAISAIGNAQYDSAWLVRVTPNDADLQRLVIG
ncbi:metallophosphoesterase [Haloarcula sp. CBA1127]|uniref:metallophosphoesterase family protein n=1 Tax=Haloarcula sp. CBA1127 TaxID=1765055 RepID=UPI00073E5C45|nr:metallophosphoesterase [Haloarcula sp. CBA1127]